MENQKTKVGQVNWFDLTVDNAATVSEFYHEVVGWDVVPLSMGDYDDYCMNIKGTDQTVTGVCHAKGANAYLPPQWLMYVTVADLDTSLSKCISNGGKVIGEKRKGGKNAFFCLVQDPAGAYVMLYEEKPDA
jgi:uncharacterized protein